ncbi:hypothetical protein [Mameliella sediminis]|uniref:hypothetical protein n=1 Tax=Mameliella sediminis TaxID=2836866 RepID=UPI001C43EEE4|nr:hypothetical protein [Mameliella sediminis]MBY6114326.1 hypothetical protein [Antarctobacter heliothermus]MBY6143899.1 hypothetical protein [Mameliella alba]MBV7393193.1 hypothetical protein [Mameliella sediminis]MBY6163335.1 hypothetical protein [Mameliella alba]MBY6171598.1 hypothetical protein [Mameliella alba]
MKHGDPMDPKGLIADAYDMPELTIGECRSIFLDWALSAPDGEDMQVMLGALLSRYGEGKTHPMTEVLREGLEKAQAPRRRGGWKSRPRNTNLN